MAIVKNKYLKDENGDIFSPVTGDESVIMNGGNTLRDFLPKRYTVVLNNTSNFQKAGLSESNWSVMKIYASILRSDASGKAIYLSLNGEKASNQNILDFRLQGGNQGYYGRAGIENAEIYLGDMWVPSNSSYVEITVLRNLSGGWHTIQSKIFSQASSANTDGGVSFCGGQFKQTIDTITSVKLSYSGTIGGSMIIELYPNVDNQ